MGTGRIRVFVLKIPIYRIKRTPTDFVNLSGLIFVFCDANMPFWTVEDAGPYKENGNILMRTSLSPGDFYLCQSKMHISPFAPSLMILPSVSPSFSRDSSGIC